MVQRRRTFTLIIAASILSSATSMHAQSSKWITLFDGKSTDAWRGYLKPDLPAGWKNVNGTLATSGGDGGNIITKDEFDNFELELEWRIAPGGNSGVFFHVPEDTTYNPIYSLTGPEMQVLDNKEHPDGKNPATSAGSNFALHAPVRDVTKPPGEWNKARLIVNGSHVEHWLNGVKVVEYELWSDDWKQRVENSKFKRMPTYGMAKTGHIALQDHGDRVAYRKIRIRKL